MADDRLNLWQFEGFSVNHDDFGEDLSIEMETTLRNNFVESSDITQRHMEVSAPIETSQDSRPGISDSFSESCMKSAILSGVKLESLLPLGSHAQSCSGSLGDWVPIQDYDRLHMKNDKIQNHVASNGPHDYKETGQERRNCNQSFNFAAGDFNPLAANRSSSNSAGDFLPERFPDTQYVEENKLKVSGEPDKDESSVMEMDFPNNNPSEYCDIYLGQQNFMNMLDPATASLFPYGSSDDEIISQRNEKINLSSENPNVSSKVNRESKRLRLGFDDYDGTAFRKRIPSVALQSSRSKQSKTDDDDDDDVCILEDISGRANMNISAVNSKSLVPQPTMIYNSLGPYYEKKKNSLGPTRVGVRSHKAKGSRFVFQAALQDLSQPKSEDTPPDGVLAVPLLRHQRIALSWMVKKEKYVSRCSGGILADDQGLGKTISTIALILKEKPPSLTESNVGRSEPEILNLDDDEDDMSDHGKSSQVAQSCQVNGDSSDGKNISAQGKCRPAGGTLIVCPTTVLRQWSDELQNRVTKKANLSILVYHGSNRTKNPSELANFDVVLTTYAIVGMEVPKQPLVVVDVDEDDDETLCDSSSPMELSSLKRKYPPGATKSSSKGKKGNVYELPEPVARPLASVGWFRVVLDEAQSIKNHRTQIARACWGLRAKRRWCLSGTPIQNAVDDLYSYFRFLRFDPYSSYRSFCSGLKGPIQRSPTNGYRKLQAVLKTVMLRRTKGTLLDGEPIINLPPKTIELKKVDFTKEERDFYGRLEADSRAQFAEYAAGGTVKQNYGNILLMLLRLRQACDHPLLVRKSNSSSTQRTTIDMTKKQIHLLNCLEASSAICDICSDPPEDAVVTSCGHVFCNQCICEHLTGDNTHCPTENCKTHLRPSLLFSIATLRSSLSDAPTEENDSDCSIIEVGKGNEHFSPFHSYGSSKINAVLEVLQSLTKPPDSAKSCSSSVDDETSISKNKLNLHNINDENRANEVSSDSSATIVGEKAIVFSQWTRMLDLLEDCLKNSSIKYRRLDGTMSIAARDKAVKDFNNLPDVSVMIMSLKAASLGLNMAAASHVILLDLWWNPTTEDQAIDRAHRIGQTRPVTVLRLTVKDTVEDRILALQQKKRKMVTSAFGENDQNGSCQTRLTVEDLRYLFMDE